MKVTLGRPHFAVPNYCYILTDAEATPSTIQMGEGGNATIRFRNLRNQDSVEVRRGDIFLIDVEAIREEDCEWLEEIARISHERTELVIVPFSLHLNSPADIAHLAAKKFSLGDRLHWDNEQMPFFLEYQAVAWRDLEEDTLREVLTTLNEMNVRSIRDTLIDIGSVFYMLGAVMFGLMGPVVSVAILIWHFRNGDVGSWRYVVWFLAGPSIFMLLTVRINLLMTTTLCTAFWFVCDSAGTDKLVWLLPIVTGSMVAFGLWNRIREYMDIRDLLSCIFSREIWIQNPEFTTPTAKIGGGQFILWRLSRLNVWRFFDAYAMPRVFISHRNSTTGLALAEKIDAALTATHRWDLYYDKKCLIGGRWRDQLADGFYGVGVFICVLTEEDRKQLDWVRRELFAAALKYASYGTPIPIIVQAGGMTIADLLESEEDRGHFDTPLHRIEDRLPILTWDHAAPDSENLSKLIRRVNSEVVSELARHAPRFLSGGPVHVCSQLVWPCHLALVAALLWVDIDNATHRFALASALVILFVDLGGLSIGRCLPRWAGGEGPQRGWFAQGRSRIRTVALLVTLSLTLGLCLALDCHSVLIFSVLTGLSINFLDHELWQVPRVLWPMIGNRGDLD